MQQIPGLDHKIIEFNINHPAPISNSETVKYLDFKNGCYDLLNIHLLFIDWRKKLGELSTASEMLNLIKSKISEGIYEHNFIEEKIYDPKKSKYFPDAITKMKEYYLQLINDPTKTHQSNKVGKELLKMHTRWVKNQQKKFLSKQNNIFSYITPLLKTKHQPMPAIINGDKILLSDQEKADELLKYFNSVLNPDSTFTHIHSNEVDEDDLDTIKFTKENVKKELLKCSSQNIFGPDGIPGIILNKCARSLALPLSILFNHILEKRDMPEEFLIAHITPIPKIPNPTLLANFRPISGTSDVFKTMERVIKEEIVSHLEKLNFLPNEQFGFRSGMSTTTQIILFQEYIVKEAATGKTIDVIYLDMEKAFDKLTFEEIISNLKKAKINGKLLNLIIIFLTKRKFLVKVNKYKSELKNCTSGVGQGCVLSAILFIIVFAQISEFLNGFEFIIHFKFADDLKLLFSYYRNYYDPAPLQNALDGLFQWCSNKSLFINATKTVHVQFGSPNPDANYSINNVQIETKEVTRDLGIYIKNDLSMSHHIETIYSTTNRKMHSVLKKVITNNSEILVKIFNAYIRPNYEYGSPIFNIPRKNIADDLEALQKTFTKRVFLRNNPNINYDQILDYQGRRLLYGMETLEKRRLYAQILIAWEMFVQQKNVQLDLDFHHNIAMQTRFGGVYKTKSNIPLNSKYYNLHFSSRISSILNQFQIKLHDYGSKETLLNHLKTIDFSTILKIF